MERDLEMIDRFDKFCRLVGSGQEANEMKLKFAHQVGLPRNLNMRYEHKNIVQENIKPEKSVVDDSWKNPKLTSPRHQDNFANRLLNMQSIH